MTVDLFGSELRVNDSVMVINRVRQIRVRLIRRVTKNRVYLGDPGSLGEYWETIEWRAAHHVIKLDPGFVLMSQLRSGDRVTSGDRIGTPIQLGDHVVTGADRGEFGVAQVIDHRPFAVPELGNRVPVAYWLVRAARSLPSQPAPVWCKILGNRLIKLSAAQVTAWQTMSRS